MIWILGQTTYHNPTGEPEHSRDMKKMFNNF